MDKPLDLHNDESVKPKKRFKKKENQMNVSSESGLFFLFLIFARLARLKTHSSTRKRQHTAPVC